jgi:hypothetical protein
MGESVWFGGGGGFDHVGKKSKSWITNNLIHSLCHNLVMCHVVINRK